MKWAEFWHKTEQRTEWDFGEDDGAKLDWEWARITYGGVGLPWWGWPTWPSDAI